MVEVNKSYPVAEQRAASVRITCPMLCALMGFTLNGIYQTIIREVQVPDKNGQDIWIWSELKGREVWLSSAEYELVTE